MVTQLSEEQEMLLIRTAAAAHAPLHDTLTNALQAALETAEQSAHHRPWSDRELDLLRDSRNTPRTIARATGRTTAAVRQRRSTLAKDEHRTDLQRRPRTPAPPQPPTISPLPPPLPFCANCDNRATNHVSYPGTRRPDQCLCPEHTPSGAAPVLAVCKFPAPATEQP